MQPGDALHIIIQARMTSTRLSGKVMLPLCDSTVLEVMFQRLPKFKDQIILATTDDGSEAPIVDLCKTLNIRYYRGDTQNVLSRYYEAALSHGARSGDTIVRLTSDCPLIDQQLLLDMLTEFDINQYDYLSNTVQRTYPRGLDVEVFTFDALQKAHSNATTEFEKEHVTTYMHTTHKEEFSQGYYQDSSNNSKYRLTLDEEDDYRAIKELYHLLDCRTDYSYATLIEILKANPHIYAINAHIEQKKK